MSKILYISYDGMTDPLGQSQVLPYLEGLSAKGYQIYLLSFEKKKNFSKAQNRIHELVNATGITWIPKFYSKRPPVVSTVYDVFRIRKFTRQIIRVQNIQIVHCRSYIAAFGGLYAKRKFGTKFIFDMRGFWPDERVEGRIWNLKNPVYQIIYHFFKRQERIFLQNADYTVSLTSAGEKIIHIWPYIPHQPIPIEVIPCCADFNHFCPSMQQSIQTQKLKEQLNIYENDFVLTYLGSIGTWYMLPEMLDFFNVLLKAKPFAIFLFITDEPEDIILNLARKMSVPLEQIRIRKAPRELVPAYIAIGNISLFFIKPVFSKKASSPTKMAEIMGMGIPVVCNSGVGDVEDMINASETGLLVSEFSESAYRETINKFDSLLQLSPEKIQKEALRYFSLADGIEKYAAIYHKLIQP